MTQGRGYQLAVRWIAIVCLGASVLILPTRWLKFEGKIRVFAQFWQEGKVEEFVRTWHDLDRALREAATEGNIAIRFTGFKVDNPEDVRTAQETCGRGAFALYPKRVWMAEEGTVINNGRDVLAAKFDPSMHWLQEHDVRWMLNLVSDGQGKGGFRLQYTRVEGAR